MGLPSIRTARRRRVAGALLLSVAFASPFATHALVATGAVSGAAATLVALSAVSHAAINGGLLVVFAATLRPGRTPLVTAMGRRINPAFHPGMEPYARAVTWAWCGFFAFQISASAILAAVAPPAAWSCFVNVLDLPLLLAMFALEGAARRLRFPGQPRVPLSAMVRGVRGGPGCREDGCGPCGEDLLCCGKRRDPAAVDEVRGMATVDTEARDVAGVRPHPTLGSYYADDSARPAYVRSLFDETAPEYDGTAALLAFGSGPWYRRHVLKLAGLAPGMTMLDVAAGTGQVTRAAAGIVGSAGTVIAVEPSAGMLRQARRAVPPDVMLIQGEAEALPLPDDCVDFLSMGYAVRHVSDLVAAFSEYLRVVRPGGTAIVMEIGPARNKIARAALGFWISRAIPALHVVFGRGKGRYARARALMGYYRDTLDGCVAPSVIEDAMRRAGFADVECITSLGLFREYVGRVPPRGG